MCATFTDDDIGKPVERTDGKVIGTVASLEEGGAYVEPAPDVVDQLKVRFGGHEIGGPFVVDESDVRAISERRVHLAEEFSRTPATSEPTDRSTDGADSASAAAESNRADGGAASATSSAASSSGVGPFDTRFQLGAAVVSGLCFLVAVLFAWTGFQGSTLPVAGTELGVVSGAAGLMLLAFFGVIALVAAIYMEPGFDH